MSDERDNSTGSPPQDAPPPPLPDPAPPPMAAPMSAAPPPAAAAPPPAAAAPPPMAAAPPATPAARPAYVTPPGRGTNSGLIVGAIVGGILVLAAILYFAGVFDSRPRTRPSGSTGTGLNAPTTGSGLSMSTLAGTWGPGCPSSARDTVTFSANGAFMAGAGSGNYTLVGNLVTLYRSDGRNGSFPMRWEMVSENMARVTNVNSGAVDTVYRCR